MEHIDRALYFNRISGGSFRAACRLENSRPSDQKRYLVLLPRNATTNKSGQLVHPVQVGEISTILPAACDSSFNVNTPGIAIRSIVSLKKQSVSLSDGKFKTTRHWFDLPKSVVARPLKEIAREVFLKRFSEDDLERLESKYILDVTIAGSEKKEEADTIIDGHDEVFANTIIELPQVDDWEDHSEDE
ncbi:unnamed protein product [Cylindrotheca closterium]|nr:unnamed protein product [Cylindrotheca closterium]